MREGLKPSSLGANLARIREKLQQISETPGLDAQVLIAHTCQKDRSWVIAHPETILTPEQTSQLEHNLKLLLEGLPLPYLLGEWEFFGRSFKLTPDVLIPRPETELLVETALAWLQANPEKRTAAEVGTGSGCISVSLAAAVPDLRITATEISSLAAWVARQNLSRYKLEDQVTIHIDDLLTDHPGPFDLIAANLPYIPTYTLHQLPIYRREPTLALEGGEDGLDLIDRLLEQTTSRLASGGVVLLEIESGQGESTLELAKCHFPHADSHVKPDLAGHPRLLVVQT